MNLRKAALAAYLVLLHVVVGMALVKTDLLSRAAISLGLVTPAQPDSEPLIAAWRAFHGAIDPSVPQGATLFLGDSITLAMPVKDVTPLAVNYGIGRQRSDQLIVSMDTYASLRRASRVVVMIGTNDLLQGRDAGIEARYQTILGKIPGQTPVVMIGVPPLTPDTEALRGVIKDDRVRAAVTSAQRACAARPTCHFISAYDALRDTGSNRPVGLQSDGIHLTAQGYALLTGLVRQALVAKSMPPRPSTSVDQVVSLLCQCPLRPPCFSSRATSVMTMPRSAALHMS